LSRLCDKQIDPFGKTGNGFINGIVDHFLGQVVGPGRVGIHPRPASDGIKTLQHFKGRSVVSNLGPVIEQTVLFNDKPPLRLRQTD